MSDENLSKNLTEDLSSKESGGIVLPALLWWAGVPLFAVILLWLFFFRG
jgi:hypothetical protein